MAGKGSKYVHTSEFSPEKKEKIRQVLKPTFYLPGLDMTLPPLSPLPLSCEKLCLTSCMKYQRMMTTTTTDG